MLNTDTMVTNGKWNIRQQSRVCKIKFQFLKNKSREHNYRALSVINWVGIVEELHLGYTVVNKSCIFFLYFSKPMNITSYFSLLFFSKIWDTAHFSLNICNCGRNICFILTLLGHPMKYFLISSFFQNACNILISTQLNNNTSII